jgi:uncharacterized membrane protein YfhO
VRRANLAFRAVAVPAGRHVVEMRYRPATVPTGVVVSAVTLLAGVVAAWRAGPRGRREAPRQAD